MIKNADIVLYDENDDSIEIPLSPTQLEIIFKILGIKTTGEQGTISCYSDTTLKKFMKTKGNPLALKPKQEEK